MTYKGHDIDTTTFPGLITVCYLGDEVTFDSIDAAKEFIDAIEA